MAPIGGFCCREVRANAVSSRFRILAVMSQSTPGVLPVVECIDVQHKAEDPALIPVSL